MKGKVDGLLQKNRELDPFYAINTFEKCISELTGEINEVLVAFNLRNEKVNEIFEMTKEI